MLNLIDGKVCQCWEDGKQSKTKGWTRDPLTEYWVCSDCRRPSKYNAVATCEGCEKKFVPDKAPTEKQLFFGLYCPSC